MQENWTIEPGLLDNRAEFDGPFYRRFRLRPAAEPLQLTDTISKAYLFPTFYGDVTCAMAVFLCSYDRACAALPHPLIRPVRMPRGRALVAFSCYEYRKVLGVPPYNEIAVTIPVLIDPGIEVPVVPMLLDVFRNFGYWVVSMPVTSRENQIRGREIWGLPKVVQRIDIERHDGLVTTRAFEPTGERYFELKVPTSGRPQPFDVTANLYTRLGDRLLQSETNFAATFTIVKHMDRLFRKGGRPSTEWLALGDSPSGQILQALEIEPHPFQFRYAEGMSSCFDLPNPGYRSAVAFANGEGRP